MVEAPSTKEEKKRIEQLRIDDRAHQMQLTDRSLCQTYMHAKAFVFPSLYEGFGLPVLEAFTCACPAVLSNTSSLPELGGDAAAYFDPKDIGSIERTLAKVVFDEDLRLEMVNKGLERAKQFSWDKTAAETKKVYLDMAGR